MKPHKHAALIKAWADGAEIERKGYDGLWYPDNDLFWFEDSDYRIKPKPDVVKTAYILLNDNSDIWQDVRCTANVKFTFDGETGKLKKAEVL